MKDLTRLPPLFFSFFPLRPPSHVWICGGAEIYRQLLPTCSVLYLTRVKREVEGDAFFPPFEDDYTLSQVIHETAEFQIERWYNTKRAHISFYDSKREAWPFQTP